MIGIRELRGDLAAHIRRAAAGESTVVTVGGRPAAVLAPLAQAPGAQTPGDMSNMRTSSAHRSSLEASGALLPPRRTDGKLPAGTVPTWGSVRLDRLLAEIRG
ncbi:MAG: type II toxin-antitoxin system prevent-host-death family antitoxin [Actinomycetota bacterium]|jgi:prevent-host-death family protein